MYYDKKSYNFYFFIVTSKDKVYLKLLKVYINY